MTHKGPTIIWALGSGAVLIGSAALGVAVSMALFILLAMLGVLQVKAGAPDEDQTLFDRWSTEITYGVVLLTCTGCMGLPELGIGSRRAARTASLVRLLHSTPLRYL